MTFHNKVNMWIWKHKASLTLIHSAIPRVRGTTTVTKFNISLSIIYEINDLRISGRKPVFLIKAKGSKTTNPYFYSLQIPLCSLSILPSLSFPVIIDFLRVSRVS